MAAVSFSGVLATNPGLEDVLDPSGTITAFTSNTFEITNATGGTWNGFKFRFTGSGFAYSGTTPTDGTITGVTVLDASANVVATASSPFGHTALADVWDALQSGDGVLPALDHLFSGIDSVTGSGGVDHLTTFGLADINTLSGDAGDDVLWARSGGIHTLVGGTGSDLFRVDEGLNRVHGSAQDGSGGAGETDVIEVGASGVDINISFSTLTNIDGLRFAAPEGTSTGVFFSVDDIGAGLLSLTLAVEGSTENASDHIGISGDPSVADLDLSGWTFSNWTRANQTVSITFLGPADHHIVGTGVADDITTGEGNDTLEGGDGNDSLGGGQGNDSLSGGDGNDTLFGSTGNDSLSGGDGDDMIFAGEGNNSISPGSGNDTVFGSGIDTVDYSATTQGITVDLSAPFVQASGAEIGEDLLLDVENVIGGSGSDALTGNGGANVLHGGAGADVLVGGIGNDTADYSETTQGVVVNLSIAFDQAIGAESGTDQLSGIENVIGGSGSDTLTGDTEANVLDGGAGADILTGGLGDDTYVVDNASDVVTENAGQGTDTIRTTLASYTLGSTLENLTFTDSGTHTGIGNDFANVMTGGSGSDTFFAGAGADTLNGGDGNDVLVGNTDIFASEADTFNGGNGSDTLHVEATDIIQGGADRDFVYVVNSNPINIDLGATGIEWIQAEFGDDVINGSTQTAGIEVYAAGGNDTVTGSALGDIIWAGAGNDTVTGGDGNDVIVGDIGADSISGGNGNDVLYVDASDTSIDGGADFDAAYIATGAGTSLNLAATHLEWVADFAGGNDTIDGSGVSANLEIYAAGGTDTVIGGSGADFLWGGAGNGTITGNGGNDILVGETGSDRLTGGEGTDALYGNGGSGADGAVDTFVFGDNWGTDFVIDFEHGTDRLDMTAVAGVHSIADLTLNSVDGHCYITFGGNLISVANMAGQITQDDFLFV